MTKWKIDYAVNGKPTSINVRRHYKDGIPLEHDEAMDLIRRFNKVSAASIVIIKIAERD